MILELLQLADSALPVGSAAHSYGLETLAEEGVLTPDNLDAFFRAYLQEAGRFDAVFVRRAWRGEDLAELNHEYEARRPARESREATLKTGRRFAVLFSELTGRELTPVPHYPLAFGAAGAFLALPEEPVVQAYLQQSLTGLVSACQRLMPVGQVAAARLLWELRPVILEAAAASERLETDCFTPLPELGSMRHSMLESRLFIS
jgi:urease accessory protein